MATDNPRRKNLLKIVVSVSAIGLLLNRIDVSTLTQALARIHPSSAILLVLIYLSGQVVSALRWAVVLAAAGINRPFGWILRLYFGAMFFNLFAPSTFGGDAVRTYTVGSDGARHATAAATVAFDRLSGLATLCAIGSVAMAVGGTHGWPPVIGWTAAAISVAIIAGPGWIVPVVMRRLPKSQGLAARFSGPGSNLWSSPRLWFRCCLASLVVHLHQIAAALLIGHELGLGVTTAYYFVFHPFGIIFGALPISFAGFGVREVGYVWALAEVKSVPIETALAFGLTWSAIVLVASACGGLVVLFGGLEFKRPGR